MPSSVDLSKVNISLAEFQRISEGKYNAGEVRLENTTKLAKMNHHVHFTSFNKTEINVSEVLAIKNAFVKALSENGVDQKEIDRIRRDLGLDSAGAGDRTLHARSLKPLSRQMIREILDRNASAISPESGVRTSEQIYGKGGMKESRMNTRDEINAALDSKPHTVDDNELFSHFHNVVTGNVDFLEQRPVEELCKMAREQLDTLMAACNGHPRENVPANASFTLPSGQTFTMDTGLSEAELARRLEDISVRMENRNTFATQPEKQARSQFSALSTPQEKMEYVDNLNPSIKDDDLKARAIIVMILHDSGVSDYESLSLPNRLNGEDARQLARHFASMDGKLTPDKLKGDQMFQQMAAKPPEKVPFNYSAYIPATSNGEYNQTIFRQLTNAKEAGKLSSPYKKLLDDTINEVRTRMGTDAFPETETINNLVNKDKLGVALTKLRNNTRITPENIRKDFLDNALVKAATRIISNAIKQAMAEAGADVKNSDEVLNLVNSRHPEFAQRLASIQSPAEIGGIVAEFKTKISDAIQRQQLVQDLSRNSMRQAQQAIADKFGVSVDFLLDQGISFSYLDRKISDLKTEYLFSKEGVFKKQEEIEAAFSKAANKFIGDRISYLDKVDTLDLPQNAKEEIKLELLSNEKVHIVNLDTLFEASKKIDMSELESLLKNNAPKEEVYNAMFEISEAIRNTVDVMLDKVVEEVGPDDRDGSINCLATMLVKSHPDLDRLLDAFQSRPDVKGDTSKDAVAANPFRRFSTDPEVNSMHKVQTNQLNALFRLPPLEKAGGIQPALDAGYTQADLPMLAKTLSLFKAATNCTDEVALQAALNPQSKARRLVDYGGRFTASVEDFRQGLNLMDKFQNWYSETVKQVREGNKNNATALNLKITIVNEKSETPIEKLVFEDLAHSDVDLNKDKPEELFDMKNNRAMRFVGRGYTTSFSISLMSLSPEKRALLYDVFDALHPLANTAEEKRTEQAIGQGPLLAARVLKNFDKVAALQNAGQLDRAHLVPILYSDLDVQQNATNDQIQEAYGIKLASNAKIMGPLHMLLEASGTTMDEAADAINNGKRLPNAPGVFSFSCWLEALDGTANEGRKTMLGDILRPSNPHYPSNKKFVLDDENVKFVFNFPDGKTIDAKVGDANNPEVVANGKSIADKIENLCGKVHVNQLNNVYFLMSQSALGTNLKDGFKLQGIASNEHMPLTFTLSKDEESGDITIAYSEPKGFPVHFSWTATVAQDGTTTVTPMVMEQ